MKVSAAARGRARHFAVQAIYQWQMNKAAVNDIAAQFQSDNDFSKVDKTYFTELVDGTINNAEDLDPLFSPHLQGLTFEQLDPVALALLRLASFELQHRVDVPYKVVINEAIKLAKKFGAPDSHKFINGVLDKAAVQVRAAEVKAQRSSA